MGRWIQDTGDGPRSLPGHDPEDLALVCPGCGAAEFTASWQTIGGCRQVRMACARCGRFIRYLPQLPDGRPDYVIERHQPGAGDEQHPAHSPPPAGWRWIGFIRQADRVWRPVAEAPTLARCWDALLHFPGDGDRLCIPVRPENGKRLARVHHREAE